MELLFQREQLNGSEAIESIEHIRSHETESLSSADGTKGLTDQHQFTTKVNLTFNNLPRVYQYHEPSVSCEPMLSHEQNMSHF